MRIKGNQTTLWRRRHRAGGKRLVRHPDDLTQEGLMAAMETIKIPNGDKRWSSQVHLIDIHKLLHSHLPVGLVIRATDGRLVALGG